MKEKKTGFSAILFAFLTLVVGWLIQEHFMTLVGFWKQAKAKTSGETVTAPATTTNENLTNESA